MDADVIKALAEWPIVVILLYLLVREQAQKEKLLTELLNQARQHAEHLVELACHGVIQQEKE